MADLVELERLLFFIEVPNVGRCRRLMSENADLFRAAAGSSHNHQAWPGGYIDHVVDVMRTAVAIYRPMSDLRELPFTLSDALLVLFLHDLEKPWRFELGTGLPNPDLVGKEQRKKFRTKKIEEYDIALTWTQHEALQYVEGEGVDYSPRRRVMNELAAFCHMCDVASARIWHSRP